jgi:alpha-N-arabinofuranosidase
MKKVDPKIKVTVAGASICEESWTAAENRQFAPDIWQPPVPDAIPFGFGGTRDWDGWLLANSVANIDFLSEHTYAYPDLAFDAQKQAFVDVHDPLPLRARRLANRVGEAFEAWQKYLDAMPALKDMDIKFIFDEWGTRFRSAQSGGGGFQRPVGMVTPLSFALFLHELFRHSGMVEASCPTGAFGTAVLDNAGDAVGLAAEGLVIKLMREHFVGALPVAVGGNSPQRPVTGTPFVDAPSKPIGSPTYPLDVVAALTGDRKTLILSVVNPTEDGQEFAPRIAGVKLRGPGKLWQLAAPSLTAANEAGKWPVIRILETPQPPLPDKLQVPPISVSVWEFEVEKA